MCVRLYNVNVEFISETTMYANILTEPSSM